MRRRTGGKFIEDLQARLPTVPSTFADLIMLTELSGRRRPPTARRRYVGFVIGVAFAHEDEGYHYDPSFSANSFLPTNRP
jgi:hypothetical protein